MNADKWARRLESIWAWGRRMVEGVPGGGAVRLIDCGERSRGSERPVVSIVLEQWPGSRVGDVVISDRIGWKRLREVVEAGSRSGLSAPEWRVHGVESIPGRAEWVAGWLLGLAEASAGGTVVVDTAQMDEGERGRLAAHLRRLAPRADVAVRTK